MLALVERTKPGPFLARTIELGTYLGVRRDGALIAMAGERLHPPGSPRSAPFAPTPRIGAGAGLAAHPHDRRGHPRRGETPFLHLTLENEPAHRIYSALGFETRAFLDVTAFARPPDGARWSGNRASVPAPASRPATRFSPHACPRLESCSPPKTGPRSSPGSTKP